MSDLTCPYCDHDCGYPDECGKEDVPHEWQCDKCEKNFIFHTHYRVYYNTSKADCLNGAEHKFKPITGYPIEYFVGRERCVDCGKEIKKPQDSK